MLFRMLFVSLLVTLVIARRGASTTTTSDLADATDVLRSARYPYAWGLGFPFGDEETELTSAAPAKKKSVKEVKAVKLVKKPTKKRERGWFAGILDGKIKHYDPKDPDDHLWMHPDDVMESIE